MRGGERASEEERVEMDATELELLEDLDRLVSTFSRSSMLPLLAVGSVADGTSVFASSAMVAFVLLSFGASFGLSSCCVREGRDTYGLSWRAAVHS